jgi:mono/diheme cytochrome c family protein
MIMELNPVRIARSFGTLIVIAFFSFCATSLPSAAEGIAPPHTSPPSPITTSINAPELLAWDAVLKELTTTNGQATAEFSFGVTNISDANVVIDRVMTSCGCTVAKLPSQPWILEPHKDGKIEVTVNLAGKSGTIFKTVTVVSTNAPKTLTVKVNIPENPEMARSRNQQAALADRQAVFRGDCARCHVEPAKDKTGQQLYVVACGICHDAEPRATSVPNLHALNHWTDSNYWKAWITTGKAGTMMPGFSVTQGGPLSDEQIASVAQYLSETVPAAPQPVKVSTAEPLKAK